MDVSCPSHSQLLRLSYRGESMRGTFVDGDCLWVSRVSFASLQMGDVVAFQSSGKAVAHRIAGRDARGFRTRGDGNLHRDAAPLAPENLIGKVMERERGGACSAVVGGVRGWRRAMALHGICRVRQVLRSLLSPSYRLLRASRLMSLLWRPQIMAARFAGSGGEFTKYIHRGETVACWIPHERRWTCRKPYDLILDPPNR